MDPMTDLTFSERRRLGRVLGIAVGVAFVAGLAAAAVFWRRQVRALVSRARPYVRKRNRVESPALIINRWSGELTKAEIGRILGGQVPFGPVNDIAEIFADPHVRAHGMLVDLALEGVAEPAVVAGTPVRMQHTPGGVHRRAPRLGEHNAEVFAELGI